MDENGIPGTLSSPSSPSPLFSSFISSSLLFSLAHGAEETMSGSGDGVGGELGTTAILSYWLSDWLTDWLKAVSLTSLTFPSPSPFFIFTGYSSQLPKGLQKVRRRKTLLPMHQIRLDRHLCRLHKEGPQKGHQAWTLQAQTTTLPARFGLCLDLAHHAPCCRPQRSRRIYVWTRHSPQQPNAIPSVAFDNIEPQPAIGFRIRHQWRTGRLLFPVAPDGVDVRTVLCRLLGIEPLHITLRHEQQQQQ